MNKPIKIKSLQAFQKYKENPFCEALVTQLTSTGKEKITKMMAVDKSDMIINSDSGEIKPNNNLLFAEKKWVDRDEFLKLFFSEISIFFDLTKNQQKLLMYIISTLEYNKDSFLFDLDDCIEKTGMAKSTIYIGLSHFCDLKIIARSNLSVVYYINPVMMFKGDRIVVAREYVQAKYPLASNGKELTSGQKKKFLNSMNGDQQP
jgi:hypothetical protein